MPPSAALDLEADLNAVLVRFATSAVLLRDLRDRGRVSPEEAAHLVASVIEVVEQIQFDSAIETAEARELIRAVAEEFGLTVTLPGSTRH